MNNINSIIEFYRKKLERKERLIKEYIIEKNSIDGFKSSKREMEYNVLYAEITLLNDFVDELEYIQKEEEEN